MKNRKIKEQLLIYFFLLTVLPLMAVSSWCFMLASRIINEKSESYTEESINTLSGNIDQLLIQMENMSLSIAYNNYVQEILQKENAGDSVTRLDVFQMEKNMILTYDYSSMRDIAIRSGDHIYRVPGSADGIPEEYYPRELSSSRRAVWHNRPSQEVIQMVRTIESTKNFNDLGTLYISIYSGYIDNLVKNINFDLKGFALVLDEQNCPINLKDVDASYVDGIGAYMAEPSGSFERIIGNTEYQYVYTTSAKTGWKTVGVISVSELHAQVTRLRISVIACVAMVSIIAIYISFRLARLFSEKIHVVTDAMQQASGGDFSLQLAEGISKNEFNDLNVGFNRMIQKINSLINTVYHAELLKKEAEYAALQAQVNPHFLYNTLDTICWQAKLSDNDEIFETTYSLASLLRASMNNRNPFITVRQELDYVQDYIQIQRARYRDRICASIAVEKELEEIKIPKLILQPIVENAYVHGLEEKGGKGNLSVKGILNEEEGMAVFVVTDDGVGMTEEQIQGVFEPKGERKGGFGLSSVHRRIQILYGEEYGVQILSAPGEGTTVILRIPAGLEER